MDVSFFEDQPYFAENLFGLESEKTNEEVNFQDISPTNIAHTPIHSEFTANSLPLCSGNEANGELLDSTQQTHCDDIEEKQGETESKLQEVETKNARAARWNKKRVASLFKEEERCNIPWK